MMSTTTTTTTTEARTNFLEPPPNGLGDKISALKYSAAFLASLRINLLVNDGDTSLLALTPLSTPSLRPTPSTDSFLPPPSPLCFTTHDDTDASSSFSLSPLSVKSPAFFRFPLLTPNSPTERRVSTTIPSLKVQDADSPSPRTLPSASAPELKYYASTTATERSASLKLVADSIAQQRYLAIRTLLSHPLITSLCIVLYLSMLSLVHSNLGPRTLPLLYAFTILTVALLATAYYLTRPYAHLSKSITPTWLSPTDTVLVARFDQTVIGTCILGWEPSCAQEPTKTRRRRSARGPHALIRAWTVHHRYRGAGVGTGLLDRAVDEVRRRASPSLDFCPRHVHSLRVFPPPLAKALVRNAARAHALLDAVLEAHNRDVRVESRRRR